MVSALEVLEQFESIVEATALEKIYERGRTCGMFGYTIRATNQRRERSDLAHSKSRIEA